MRSLGVMSAINGELHCLLRGSDLKRTKVCGDGEGRVCEHTHCVQKTMNSHCSEFGITRNK